MVLTLIRRERFVQETDRIRARIIHKASGPVFVVEHGWQLYARGGDLESTTAHFVCSTAEIPSRLSPSPTRRASLMVHGFDVPLNQPEQFDALIERTRPLLRELNMQIKTVRTNLKELGLQDWEDSFLSQLYGAGHAGAERRHAGDAGRHFGARNAIHVVQAAHGMAFRFLQTMRRQTSEVTFIFPGHC
jgi:hypothetical protein